MNPESPDTATPSVTPGGTPPASGRRRALLALAGSAAAFAGGWAAWRLQGGAVDDGLAADELPAGFWALTFETPDGTPLNWQGLQGRGLILNFWATWCPPCVREMPELDRLHTTLAPRGWQVVGLAVDGPTPVREFLSKVRVGFATGLAGFGGTELAKALGNTAGGLPYTVVIDAQGRIRHRKMGETHHDELLAWVDEVEASNTKKL